MGDDHHIPQGHTKMNGKSLSSLSLFLVVMFGFVSGCSKREPSKEAIIAATVKGAMASRDKVLSSFGGMYSDFKSYPVDNGNGVVHEYVFAADAIIDRSKYTADFLKEKMKRTLSSNSLARRAFEMGIDLRLIFKSYDGDIICDVTITAADL